MIINIDSINAEAGKILASIARDAAEKYLREGIKIELPCDTPEALQQHLGVFISLKKADIGGKEKSISSTGYPLPVKPLVEGVIDSAIAAAIRARANGLESLDQVKVEVSLIGSIEPLSAERRAGLSGQIKIGEDGLLIERGFHRALYLPQAALEHGWDGESFLSECCVKAGLMPDAWVDQDTKVYIFKIRKFEQY